MSTKINLLPDIRQAKINDKNNRRLAVTVAISVSVVCAGLLLLTILIIQGQALRISQLNNSIKSKQQQISSYPDVNKILTTAAQLDSLPQLYSQRVYMTQLTQILTKQQPNDTAFQSLTIDSTNSINLTVVGRSYMSAARLAKAMEASTLPNNSQVHTFDNVLLSAVVLANGQTSFSITATVNKEATSASQ